LACNSSGLKFGGHVWIFLFGEENTFLLMFTVHANKTNKNMGEKYTKKTRIEHANTQMSVS